MKSQKNSHTTTHKQNTHEGIICNSNQCECTQQSSLAYPKHTIHEEVRDDCVNSVIFKCKTKYSNYS